MRDLLRLADGRTVRAPGSTTGRTDTARTDTARPHDAVAAPPHHGSPARTTPETETVR
ncbi:hypothetical protein SAMN05216489_03281 [Streptomyces sp. 3213]|uniref:hypothetical protein n=1 Tax=Streptomyces sp. 3213.3 TaxID=1855348 RepID=UPI000894D853|nr:hypothetical protein [Streptomyces sp. 3213.3]SED37427.1 hypothetical protein SAMN05216489_03281 [Streptomyces sp. 3213] [Streptomyces sp. 3213.3]